MIDEREVRIASIMDWAFSTPLTPLREEPRMSKVRAKFRVTSIARKLYQSGDTAGVGVVTLNPVTGGSDENKEFWKATPHGSIELHVTAKDPAELFELGRAYYVEFTLASQE